MKIIKNFTSFINENYLKNQKECLNNYNDKIVIKDGEEYKRYLETDDFIYFNNGENDNGSTLMYDKNTLELVSDNYFATDDLFKCLLNRDYVWASDDAKYSMDEMEKENNG